MAKIGDIVRYLNTTGGGVIRRIEGNIAYVDEDGFETPVMLRECVVVTATSTHVPAPQPKFGEQASASTKDTTPKPKPKVEETFVIEETPEGEKLNIVLGYEAVDLKRLSTTTYDTYLVNDSNYYLTIIYMSHSSDSNLWTTRYAGTVEPGIQLLIEELHKEGLSDIDRVAIQYIAYKKGKEFEAKMPAFVELKLDTTKFFKLHCFQPNEYFDQPVIALTIAKDDRPNMPLEIDATKIRKAMTDKIREDNKGMRPVSKRKNTPATEPLEVDLHIAELVDNTNGLSNADMLNLQIDTFRRVMDQNLRNIGRKIIFIHGKGDGVLRKALLKELSYRYKGCEVQDASFREYGFGATQVTIRNC